ncbi:hypothetical protein [Gracilibacillus sp. Marseille-QA3620]
MAEKLKGRFSDGARTTFRRNNSEVLLIEKLAGLVGSYNLIMGMVMIGGALINHPDAQALIPVLIIGYVVLIAYVNTRMIDLQICM